MRPIAAVSTSTTAFIGFFTQGPTLDPVLVTSFADFEHEFGGLEASSEASYAIHQYFANGGRVAFVVRVEECPPATRAEALLDGLTALDGIAPKIFNLLCIPAAAELADGGRAVYETAAQYCFEKRAFLIVDIAKRVDTVAEMMTWLNVTGSGLGKSSAVYFPRLEIRDPLNAGHRRNVASSGTLAGLYARTDTIEGVWKAPAGTEATLRGASVATTLNDQEQDELSALGINVLRSFPAHGNVAWGARTLDGADQNASEWKYVPVRRTALFIKQSLYQGLDWVVFEPNDEPLWEDIRHTVGEFLHNLFRRGAFQGATPADAYFVKCDRDTTTQNDIDHGVVNILVGFAPLRPAEFIILEIQQSAGRA